MRVISEKHFRENKNTRFVFHTFFFARKSCQLEDNVEKYYRSMQATDVHCVLDT